MRSYGHCGFTFSLPHNKRCSKPLWHSYFSISFSLSLSYSRVTLETVFSHYFEPTSCGFRHVIKNFDEIFFVKISLRLGQTYLPTFLQNYIFLTKTVDWWGQSSCCQNGLSDSCGSKVLGNGKTNVFIICKCTYWFKFYSIKHGPTNMSNERNYTPFINFSVTLTFLGYYIIRLFQR